MSNGTRPGVLIRDLLSGDGPYARVAEDFLTGTCSGCGRPVERDAIHHDSGYLCAPCWARVAGHR